MLNLDSVKTLTIYTKKEIHQLNAEFKVTLNEGYETESPNDIQGILRFVQLCYYLSDVPHFLEELNRIGDIQMTSVLEILWMKCRQWKKYNQVFEPWIGSLMFKLQKVSPTLNMKPQILSHQIEKSQETKNIYFYASALQNASKSSNTELMEVVVSFFRVFLISELQHKKTQFKLVQEGTIFQDWKNLNKNIISIAKLIDNLKKEEICVSVSYWLCSTRKQFIMQCVGNGIISFLLLSLGNKGITEWYGKKIIQFLKLLFLEIDLKQRYFSLSDFQSCLAKFTMKFDSQIIIQQIRSLLSPLDVDSSQKIENQKETLKSYQEKKDSKQLKTLIQQSRILVLYGENINMKEELDRSENEQYFEKIARYEENLQILIEIFNLLAYNYKFKKEDNRQLARAIIQKISSILSSSKLKSELNSDKKKKLISLVRILKQLLQNKQKKKETVENMKQVNILKKFYSYSDCTNFQFERELFSLRREMEKEDSLKEEKKSDGTVMNALVKHLNESASQNKKNQLEDDLQQVQLFYEMVSKGQHAKVSAETVSAISKKVRVQKKQTESVQIQILDSSEAQRNKQISQQINYYAILSLGTIEEKYGSYGVEEKELRKVIHIGKTTEDMNMLKTVVEYLQVLQVNQQIPQKYEKQVEEVFRRNKNLQGEDYEIPTKEAPPPQPEKVQTEKKDLVTLLQTMKNRELSEEELYLLSEYLRNLSKEKDIRDVILFINEFEHLHGENQLTYLKFLLGLAQNDETKHLVFHDGADSLVRIFDKTQNSLSINFIFVILNQLIKDFVEENRTYFEKFYDESFTFLSKQSVQFTDTCLDYFQYSSPEERNEAYNSFIYKSSELVSRQAFYINQKMDQWDKFWQFHKQSMKKNLIQQRKLPINFMKLFALKCKTDIWKNFQLIELLQIILASFQTKNSQIFSKQPSEKLMRKLLKISSILIEVNKNEDIDIDQIIEEKYNQVIQQLSAHPMLKDPLSLKQKSESYIVNLLLILLYIIRRNKSLEIIGNKADQILIALDRVRQYKNPTVNELSLEIIRAFLLKNKNPDLVSDFLKFLGEHGNQINSKLTSDGATHLIACQNIILALKKKDEKTLKREFMAYFFPEADLNRYEEENLSLTDQQLVKHLKKLINPPYQYGIKVLQKHIKFIEWKEYANVLVRVFVKSPQLYQEDTAETYQYLEEIQQKIAESIWASSCQLNEQFYAMISMNIIGLKICLRKKGIGVEGVKITCDRLLNQSDENILACIKILHDNAQNKKELTVIQEKKIATIVNRLYKQKSGTEKYAQSIADFVGSTSKLKQIQIQYKIQQELYDNLRNYVNNSLVLSSTIFALSGLVFTNQQNQKLLGDREKVKVYVYLMSTHSDNLTIFDKGCSLLCNLIYKNQKQIRVFLQLEVQKTIMGLFQDIPYHLEAYKRFLRLIGNLSLDLEAATSIIRAKFFFIWNNIIKAGEDHNHEEVILYAIDIIFNLVNFHEIQAKNIAYKISETDCLWKIIYLMQKYSLNTDIVKSGLDAVEKILILDVNRVRALDYGILKCLQDISNSQSWNQSILKVWVRVLFTLVSGSSIDDVLNSEVLLAASQFVKSHAEIDQRSLELLKVINDRMVKEGNLKKIVKGGVIDLYVQIIKVRHLPAPQAGSIIDTFEHLHQQKKILLAHSYVKIFEGLMSRLEIQFKDWNSKKIITLLVKIRDRIIINTKAASILLEFGYVFLTQSDSMTLKKYHRRVKQFICLLSYFIAFNVQLKLIFKQEGFISILESWIRIDTSLDEQDNSVGDACRICIFAIENQQRFLVNMSESQAKEKIFYKNLAKPATCLLYRADGSNKSACIRYDQETRELIAYKSPDGMVKEKYRTPLYEVVCVRSEYTKDDPILRLTYLGKSTGLFQRQPIVSNCATIIALVGEELSIRKFQVEFPPNNHKQAFLQNFKLATSHQFKEYKAKF